MTVPSLNPFLICADVEASLDFVVSAFGLRRGEIDGGHGTAYLGDFVVYLAPAQEGLVPARTLPASHSLLLAYVEDVDAVFARARQAGAEVAYEPTDMPYGQRECGLRDLDGNLWSFATPTR
ncbi:VOC family protein [Amycolatopsis suaedae]|uniref:Bleomycin resistance protein n=1 Tax=Amycolatopsis suaedae TaxID=2510978 RepID=A0A4Q7JBL9_9PSEU|nr:VOC family protein [Amycolatopsis suaedae]RZQ65230.1 bleomycin resistance protein [Amycolatopsis suaedae]